MDMKRNWQGTPPNSSVAILFKYIEHDVMKALRKKGWEFTKPVTLRASDWLTEVARMEGKK